jgi:molybdopterin converting factor small subunit
MKINIKYFGMILEYIGIEKEIFFSEGDGTIHHLRKELEIKYPSLSKISYRVAVNKSLSEGKFRQGDEIALLPPFAGG